MQRIKKDVLLQIEQSARRFPAIGFNKILVATDFSPSSTLVTRYAASLAHRYAAKLYLATVIDPTLFNLAGHEALRSAIDLAWKDIRKLASEISEHEHVAGMGIESIVRSGNACDEILRVAQSENIDLIAVGTQGRTGASRFLLGSVAQGVFQHALVPVLLIGPHLSSDGWSQGAKHVLFPTDLTPASMNALPWALSMAREYSAKLTMLHVSPPFSEGTLGVGDSSDIVLEESIRGLLPVSDDVLWEIAIVHGSAAEQVLKFSTEKKCDRIVFGIRRQHTTLERISSSTAYEILRGATCPILSVREGARMNVTSN